MSYEPVDIYLLDRTALANPVPGVVVKVLNQQGTLIFGQALTDASGKASFLLPSDAAYQLRFFKQQVNFTNPLFISVQQAPTLNSFNILCEPFTPPISTDPRLCIASGFFRRPDGSPAANVDIHFIAKFDPVLLDGDAVLVERVIIRTDKTGYAQVSLIRFAQYDTTIEGFEDCNRIINVPDLATVNLPDLLFPTVAQITFSPAPPFNVPLNDILLVTPTVVTSDGRVLDGTATGDVNWSSSDLNTLGIAVGPTQITLIGVAAGSANLQATRGDQTIVKIPDSGITGVPAPAVVA